MTAPKRPVMVTRDNGEHMFAEAHQMLLDGEDTLTAAHHVYRSGA